MRFLITGCAGFIGFHLISRLCLDGHTVHGIDNLNNYYDVSLKEKRLKILKKFKNFIFYKQDLNNLENITDTYDIAINLAAQAGVRLPKESYHKYEHSNVNGFNSFLKFCKKQNINKVIYASSSSVYSGNKEYPYSENMILDPPSSKYAETKIINEKEAHKYAVENDCKVIGLRFFTVYGPFGRPDMAYYSFTKNILERKKISLFNDGTLERDMTYIADVVSGIISSIRFFDNKFDHEIFNIGNNNPVKTIEVINKIEKEFSMKANIEYVQRNSEVQITNADCTKSSCF